MHQGLKYFIFAFSIAVAQTISAASLHLVSYNVENLFDWQHDKNHQDFEYLPIGDEHKETGCRAGDVRYIEVCLKNDWTQAVVEKKIEQIASVLEETTSKNPAIDLLGVIEIENKQVAELLGKRLGGMKSLITTGSDTRGINVALLYRESEELKLLRWREIAVSNKHLEGKSTRNILEAIFLLKGAHKLAVYVNHWPSQNNSPNARVDAARSLKLAVLWAKLRGIKNAIAMGDFNVVDGDFPHALKNELQEGLGQLVDVFDLFSDSKKSTLPMGSYFFSKRMQWNFLDRFFISKALTDTNNEIKINADSFAVLQGERNRGSYTYSQGLNSGTVINGVPKKFDKNSGTGAADHFPISIELEIK